MGINTVRAGELYDLLASHPEGMTSQDIMFEKEWSEGQFSWAVQTLRDVFSSDGDTITLVAEPQGFQEGWLYILIDGSAVNDEDQSRWVGIMLGHIERRVLTMKNVLATGVKATRGNSTLGKKVRIYHLHISRALEEVRLLANDDGLRD